MPKSPFRLGGLKNDAYYSSHPGILEVQVYCQDFVPTGFSFFHVR